MLNQKGAKKKGMIQMTKFFLTIFLANKRDIFMLRQEASIPRKAGLSSKKNIIVNETST